MVVESLISSQGCPVEVCSNGAAALATLTQARCEQNPFHVVRVRLAADTVAGVRISESHARSDRSLMLSCSCARPDAPRLGTRRHDRIRGRGEAAGRISLAAGPAHHYGLREHARRADDGHSRRLRVRKRLQAAPGAPHSKSGTERVQLVPSLPDDAGSTTTGKSPSLPSSSRTCSASVQRRRQEQLRMPHPLLALPPLLLPLPPTLSLPAERRQCTINCTAPKAISFGSRSEVPCHHARYLFAPAAFRKLLPEGSARQQQRSSTIL
jgi:hypothetical protein